MTGLAHATASVKHDSARIQHLANYSDSSLSGPRHTPQDAGRSSHAPSTSNESPVPAKGRAVSAFDAANADQKARTWAFATLRGLDASMRVVERQIGSLEEVGSALLRVVLKLRHHVSFEAQTALMVKERSRLRQDNAKLRCADFAARKQGIKMLAKVLGAWSEMLEVAGWAPMMHVRVSVKLRLILIAWKLTARSASHGRRLIARALGRHAARRSAFAVCGSWRHWAARQGACRDKLAKGKRRGRRLRLCGAWCCWCAATDASRAKASRQQRAAARRKTAGHLGCAWAFDELHAHVRRVRQRGALLGAVISRAAQTGMRRCLVSWAGAVRLQRRRMQAIEKSAARRQVRGLRRLRECQALWRHAVSARGFFCKSLHARFCLCRRKHTRRIILGWQQAVWCLRVGGKRGSMARWLERPGSLVWLEARGRLRDLRRQRHRVAAWWRHVDCSRMVRLKFAWCMRSRSRHVVRGWKAAVEEDKNAKRRVQRIMSAWAKAQARCKQIFFGLWWSRHRYRLQRRLAGKGLVAANLKRCRARRAAEAFGAWLCVFVEALEDKAEEQRRPHASSQMQRVLVAAAWQRWRSTILAIKKSQAKTGRALRHWALRALSLAWRWLRAYCAQRRQLAAAAGRIVKRWRCCAVAPSMATWKDHARLRRTIATALDTLNRRLTHRHLFRSVQILWAAVLQARSIYAASVRARGRWLQRQLQQRLANSWEAWAQQQHRLKLLGRAAEKIMLRGQCLPVSVTFNAWWAAAGESRRLNVVQGHEKAIERVRQLESQVSAMEAEQAQASLRADDAHAALQTDISARDRQIQALKSAHERAVRDLAAAAVHCNSSLLLFASRNAQAQRSLIKRNVWRGWSASCHARHLTLLKVEAQWERRIKGRLVQCVAVLRQQGERRRWMRIFGVRLAQGHNRRRCWQGFAGWALWVDAAKASEQHRMRCEERQRRFETAAVAHALSQWSMAILAQHVKKEERARYRHKSIVRMLRGSNEVKLKIQSQTVAWLVPGYCPAPHAFYFRSFCPHLSSLCCR